MSNVTTTAKFRFLVKGDRNIKGLPLEMEVVVKDEYAAFVRAYNKGMRDIHPIVMLGPA